MKLFADRTIAQRMRLLVTTLGAAFVAMIVAYAAVAVLDNNIATTKDELGRFRSTIDTITIETLQARRDEKDFLLRRDASYLDKHAKTMAQLKAHFDEAEKTAPNEELLAQVRKARGALDEYQKSFTKMSTEAVSVGLNENSGLHGELRNAVHEVEAILDETSQVELTASMLMLRRHEKDFLARHADKYLEQHAAEVQTFKKLLAAASVSRSATIAELMSTYAKTFEKAAAGVKSEDQQIEVLREAVHTAEPIFDQLVEDTNATIEKRTATLAFLSGLAQAILFIVLLATAAAVAYLVKNTYDAITNPLQKLDETLGKLSSGQHDARSRITTNDEFGHLSTTLDTMLDDRITAQLKAEAENERLNNSVIELLEAVADLSQRDLTVRAPIAEDVTGPVADAINLMAKETAEVLGRIRGISHDVEQAALTVKQQSDKVTQVAGDEQRVVADALHRLDEAARAMNEIANLAQNSTNIAQTAISATNGALRTVEDTVEGMSDIRETISETEKRIKRLGERSQEITGIVEIINSIAERTHVLALNASMQAAVAGEAGRGFAVVADEVQRLAESSRNSTSQIAALVNNIRSETAETMATMNRTIEQVIAGSNRAETAGRQMHETMKNTDQLVSAVNLIAARSSDQARLSAELQERAKELLTTTQTTDSELKEQSAHAENLLLFSKSLLDSVKVFKLPATNEA
ncbi:MAG TPA: HAMP domain-containing methyl-accepting chemotaxis protein [Gammaproteobacteria bacterium]